MEEWQASHRQHMMINPYLTARHSTTIPARHGGLINGQAVVYCGIGDNDIVFDEYKGHAEQRYTGTGLSNG